VLDVKDRLVKELGDVRVVQVVDDLLAATLTNDEPKMAQLPELVRDRRRFHADRVSELTNRARPFLQSPQDLHPARGRQNLHALGDKTGGLCVDIASRRDSMDSVTHPNI